jgi:hypothetical protein
VAGLVASQIRINVRVQNDLKGMEVPEKIAGGETAGARMAPLAVEK